MRAADRVGRTVVLRLRFDDFTRATRSHTLPRADRPHRRPSSPSPAASWPRPARSSTSQGLTLVGIAVANLDDADAVQLILPFDRRTTPAARLDAALDDVRDALRLRAPSPGPSSSAATTDLDVPLLPD